MSNLASKMDALTKQTIVATIAEKFGYDQASAEAVADDMIRDDFPKNGIKTMDDAYAYIDYVYSMTIGA